MEKPETPKILVIDVNEDMSRMTGFKLASQGFKSIVVKTAEDGEQAIREAREKGEPFAAVLLEDREHERTYGVANLRNIHKGLIGANDGNYVKFVVRSGAEPSQVKEIINELLDRGTADAATDYSTDVIKALKEALANPDRPKVLLIDRDQKFISSTKGLLWKKGFYPVIAGDIEEAKREISVGGFSAVVIDNFDPILRIADNEPTALSNDVEELTKANGDKKVPFVLLDSTSKFMMQPLTEERYSAEIKRLKSDAVVVNRFELDALIEALQGITATKPHMAVGKIASSEAAGQGRNK